MMFILGWFDVNGWAVCFGFDLRLVVLTFMLFAISRFVVCIVSCFCLNCCDDLGLVYLSVCVAFLSLLFRLLFDLKITWFWGYICDVLFLS